MDNTPNESNIAPEELKKSGGVPKWAIGLAAGIGAVVVIGGSILASKTLGGDDKTPLVQDGTQGNGGTLVTEAPKPKTEEEEQLALEKEKKDKEKKEKEEKKKEKEEEKKEKEEEKKRKEEEKKRKEEEKKQKEEEKKQKEEKAKAKKEKEEKEKKEKKELEEKEKEEKDEVVVPPKTTTKEDEPPVVPPKKDTTKTPVVETPKKTEPKKNEPKPFVPVTKEKVEDANTTWDQLIESFKGLQPDNAEHYAMLKELAQPVMDKLLAVPTTNDNRKNVAIKLAKNCHALVKAIEEEKPRLVAPPNKNISVWLATLNSNIGDPPKVKTTGIKFIKPVITTENATGGNLPAGGAPTTPRPKVTNKFANIHALLANSGIGDPNGRPPVKEGPAVTINLTGDGNPEDKNKAVIEQPKAHTCTQTLPENVCTREQLAELMERVNTTTFAGDNDAVFKEAKTKVKATLDAAKNKVSYPKSDEPTVSSPYIEPFKVTMSPDLRVLLFALYADNVTAKEINDLKDETKTVDRDRIAKKVKPTFEAWKRDAITSTITNSDKKSVDLFNNALNQYDEAAKAAAAKAAAAAEKPPTTPAGPSGPPPPPPPKAPPGPPPPPPMK